MTPEQLKLANKIEVLREKHRPDWQVEQEPHDYPDGTKHFNHVRYRTDGGMTVEVASYVTPDLGNLLCLLHNNIDQFVAALRAPDARVKEALELAEKADEIHANCDECGGEGAPEECEFCFPSADDARIARRAALSHQPGTGEAAALDNAPKSPALDTATVEVPNALNVVRQMVEAYDAGQLRMESPEIGDPDSGIPLHPWHEEMLHYARTALAAKEGA